MQRCLQVNLGFDINKIFVISVRPMAASDDLQAHGFIWLCRGWMMFSEFVWMFHGIALGLIRHMDCR